LAIRESAFDLRLFQVGVAESTIIAPEPNWTAKATSAKGC
jgi:hypothetical protein